MRFKKIGAALLACHGDLHRDIGVHTGIKGSIAGNHFIALAAVLPNDMDGLIHPVGIGAYYLSVAQMQHSNEPHLYGREHHLYTRQGGNR